MAGQRERERGGGRAVGMRRERAWTKLLDDWDASTRCELRANTELEQNRI
jgi:hypothetical protein